MKQIVASLRSNRRIFLFLSLILIFGILTGIYFSIINKDSISSIMPQYLQNLENNHLQLIIFHLSVISIIFVLSFLIIGPLIGTIYLFIEGASIGFIAASIVTIYGIKGIIFSILFFLITKLIYLCIYFLLFNKFLNIAKAVYRSLIHKSSAQNTIYSLSQGILIFLILILIYDTILYFITPKIINLLLLIIQ